MVPGSVSAAPAGGTDPLYLIFDNVREQGLYESLIQRMITPHTGPSHLTRPC
jgi:hypothetical protein